MKHIFNQTSKVPVNSPLLKSWSPGWVSESLSPTPTSVFRSLSESYSPWSFWYCLFRSISLSDTSLYFLLYSSITYDLIMFLDVWGVQEACFKCDILDLHLSLRMRLTFFREAISPLIAVSSSSLLWFCWFNTLSICFSCASARERLYSWYMRSWWTWLKQKKHISVT